MSIKYQLNILQIGRQTVISEDQRRGISERLMEYWGEHIKEE